MLPTPIVHRYMEYHYTKYTQHIAQCTYTYDRCTPPIDHRCMEYCYTKEVSHIAECTYTDGKWTLLQLTINIWTTTVPQKFNR